MGEAQSDTDRVLAVGGEVELYLGVVLSRYKVLPLGTGVQQYEVISLRDDLSLKQTLSYFHKVTQALNSIIVRRRVVCC